MSIIIEDNLVPAAANDELYLFPASFAQQRLWFIDQLTPHNPVYNIVRAYTLQGPLNIEILTRSINVLIERHESLRTAFVSVEDSLHQAILPQLPFRFQTRLPEEPLDSSGTYVDLRHLPQAERETARQHCLSVAAHHPFDLTEAPLFRLLLMQHDQQAWTLLLSIHHIIADGQSLNIFFAELSALYDC